MRVIAGAARGRPLAGPPGPGTRPTSDLVKGALFSMLETILAADRANADDAVGPGRPELWFGVHVLDLYAGTGALGIEALSRGAAWCDFVEVNAAARRTIERNLRATGLADRGRVVGVDVERVLRGAGHAALRPPYALAVLDPPYADATVGERLVDLAASGLLGSEALVTVEHSRRLDLAATYAVGAGRPAAGGSETWGALVELRQRRHGDTVLSIYRYEEAAGRGEERHGDHGDLSGQL